MTATKRSVGNFLWFLRLKMSLFECWKTVMAVNWPVFCFFFFKRGATVRMSAYDQGTGVASERRRRHRELVNFWCSTKGDRQIGLRPTSVYKMGTHSDWQIIAWGYPGLKRSWEALPTPTRRVDFVLPSQITDSVRRRLEDEHKVRGHQHLLDCLTRGWINLEKPFICDERTPGKRVHLVAPTHMTW